MSPRSAASPLTVLRAGSSAQEAETLKVELHARLAECHLEMHPTKTKIVYWAGCAIGHHEANKTDPNKTNAQAPSGQK
jgi:hypothetical protein